MVGESMGTVATETSEAGGGRQPRPNTWGGPGKEEGLETG